MNDLRDLASSRGEPLFEAPSALAVRPPVDTVPAMQAPAVMEVRAGLMSLPVPEMLGVLAEYQERRDAFRAWLLSQMKPGVHYGVPPGCEPDSRINPAQWKARPSLYQSGADLLCDLLCARCEFTPVNDAGTGQAIEGKTSFFYSCRLFSQANEKLLGQGVGAGTVGAKKRDANAAVKIACKCAKVAAVINWLGISDLFTQDLEELAPERHDNPTQHARAPKTAPRAERVTKDDVAPIHAEWILHRSSKEQGMENWSAWMTEKTGKQYITGDYRHLTKADLAKCWDALGVPKGDA